MIQDRKISEKESALINGMPTEVKNISNLSLATPSIEIKVATRDIPIVPEIFLDPFTDQIMRRCVMSRTGELYDLSNLHQQLDRKQMQHPKTGQPLPGLGQWREVITINTMIKEFLEMYPQSSLMEVLEMASNPNKRVEDLSYKIFLLGNVNAVLHEGKTLLHIACERNANTLIQALLEQPQLVLNPIDKAGNTPIMYYAAYGSEPFDFRSLLEKKANPHQENNQNETLITWAAKYQTSSKMFDALEPWFTAIRKQNKKNKEIPLIQAAMADNNSSLTFFIRRVYADEKNQTEENVLHITAMYGNLALAEEIVKRFPAMRERRDKNGMSPWMRAVDAGKVHLLKILWSDKFNKIDLHQAILIAADKGHVTVLDQLSESKLPIDFNYVDEKIKNSALHLAANQGHGDVVAFLLQQPKLIVDKQNKAGFTPMMLAAKHGHGNIMYMLWMHNKNYVAVVDAISLAIKNHHYNVIFKFLELDIDMPIDELGNTLLHLVVAAKQFYLIDKLLKSMPNLLNMQNKTRDTPLHIAIVTRDAQIVRRLLLEKNINLNLKDQANETAEALAQRLKLDDVLQLFQDKRNEKLVETEFKHSVSKRETTTKIKELKLTEMVSSLNKTIMPETKETPSHFIDKIDTLDPIFDPVVAADGYIYESTAIKQHCDRLPHPNSPMTNAPLADKQFWSIPSFKEHMATYYKHHPHPDFNTGMLVAEIKNGNLIEVKRLIYLGVNVNVADEQGNTPLHLAILLRLPQRRNIINLLLAEDLDLTVKNKENLSVLSLAIRIEDRDTVKQLLRNSQLKRSQIINEALLLVAHENRSWAIEGLIQSKANLEITDIERNTPLLHAAGSGAAQAAQMFIHYGADVNARNDIGNTTWHMLMLSFTHSWSPVANALISAKADINVINAAGFSPLHLAIKKHSYERLNFLLEHSADPSLLTGDKRSALHIAVDDEKTDVKIIETLLLHKADLMATDSKNVTAWQTVLRRKPNPFDQYLSTLFLKYATEAQQNQILFWACANSQQLLNANVKILDEENNTLLHCAARAGNTAMIVSLLERRADVCSINTRGETPIDCATQVNHEEILKLLRKESCFFTPATNPSRVNLKPLQQNQSSNVKP